MNDWRSEIVVGVLVKQRLEEVDRDQLWDRHLPEVAATESELADVERRLGHALDPTYREFLGYANGWKGLWHDVDLFGTRELLGAPPMDAALRQLGAVSDEQFRHALGVGKGDVLPIGASPLQPDMFLICQPWSATPGAVMWYTGLPIGRFPNFREFYLSMVDNTREEIRDLEHDAGPS